MFSTRSQNNGSERVQRFQLEVSSLKMFNIFKHYIYIYIHTYMNICHVSHVMEIYGHIWKSPFWKGKSTIQRFVFLWPFSGHRSPRGFAPGKFNTRSDGRCIAVTTRRRGQERAINGANLGYPYSLFPIQLGAKDLLTISQPSNRLWVLLFGCFVILGLPWFITLGSARHHLRCHINQSIDASFCMYNI